MLRLEYLASAKIFETPESMDRLFCVKSKELHFSFEVGKKAMVKVELHNVLHTMHAAFKVLTTDPSTFWVRPALAIVPPLGTASFEVTMAAPQQLPPSLPFSSDRLILKSVMVPTGKASDKDLNHLFATMKKHVFTDANLRIIYTGPQILRSLAQLDCSQSLDGLAEVLKDTYLDEQDKQGNTALHMAASRGNYLMVKALLEGGANVDVKNNMGSTALMEAIFTGHRDVVRIMLTSGADTHLTDSRGRNAFHVAVKSDRVEILRLLLEGGIKDANVDQGWTPLHDAIAPASNPEAVRLLLHSKCLEGWTALHYAVSNGNLDMVEVLLDYGASVKCRDHSGKTPYDIALQKGHTHLLDAVHLREKLQRAARKDNVSEATDCLQQGASPDGSDQNGWTPLHIAAFKGHLPVVKLLLHHSADVNCRDHESQTPLHCAVETGHKDVVQHLMQHGADVSARNRKGMTPLQLAVAMNYAGIACILEKMALTRYSLEILSLHSSDVNAVAILSALKSEKGEKILDNLQYLLIGPRQNLV